ncbi:MAG: hypothetical protein JWM05_1330 [Acidimicrobiales bacterium]|nr:hypothetical protein [Acidimicrobiales bacterium]
MAEHEGRGRWRGRALAATAVAALVAGPATVPAEAAPPAPAVAPKVSITAQNPGYVTVRTCQGTTLPVTSPSFALTSATAPPSAVQVRVHVTGGSLVAGRDYAPLAPSVRIGRGDLGGTLPVPLKRVVRGTIAVSLDPGPGYGLGTPATATLAVKPSNVLSCTVLPPFVIDASVGDAFPKAPLVAAHVPSELYDTVIQRVGNLPPGIQGQGTGPYSGRYTSPGTYRFRFDFALANLVLGQLGFTVHVRPAAAPGTVQNPGTSVTVSGTQVIVRARGARPTSGLPRLTG